MQVDLTKIEELKQDLIQSLQKIKNETDLEAFRIQHLSRQGTIAQLFDNLKNITSEEKRLLGPTLNQLKQNLQSLFDEKKEICFQTGIKADQEKQKHFDVSLSKCTNHGSLHPYTHITRRIEQIFISMGFAVVDGPELETEFFNFTALNVSQNHPAREDSDTFWIDEKFVIRTQTSPTQIRTMLTQKPPIAIIAPGRVARNEAQDASHDFMFSQIEGMMIDKDISIAHLLATLKTFLTQFFEQDINIRLRPGYFPFVEPGLEVDASCPFCTQGCSTCKRTRWIELGGSGLIHPNVLKAGGIDPTIYSGFAFGLGLDRLTMLKYNISDVRLLRSSNINFLKQF